MRYSGDLAAIQQSLARCHDLVARRVAVLAALDAGPGDVVLEVGCGGGTYLREIATAVGEQGRAIGYDVSADQVAAARQYCDGLTNVTVDTGDLTGLAIDNETVDAVVAVQVLEYVADVDRALREIRRVARPGGRLVNVATNWAALFWSGGDPSLTAAVLAAWEQHAFHPNLPVELPRRLHAAGFGGTTQQPLTIVNRRFHPNSFSWWAAQLMGAHALGGGTLDRNDIDAWLSSLVEADAAGTHFLSSVPILTVATALPRTTSPTTKSTRR